MWCNMTFNSSVMEEEQTFDIRKLNYYQQQHIPPVYNSNLYYVCMGAKR